MVACKIKQELDFVNSNYYLQYYVRDLQYYVNTYTTLKNNLPSSVTALLWDSYVLIESRKHSGYTLYGSARGNIYTYPYNYEGGSNQKWIVYLSDHGRYFRLNNKQNELFLYATGDGSAYGDYSSSIKDYSDQWQITPIENGDYFYFENRANYRILDANDIFCSSVFSCSSSRLCCCTTVHAYSSYKRTNYQQWKIL